MQALERTVEKLNVDLDKTGKELEDLKKRSAPAAQGLQKVAVAAGKAAAAYFTVQKAADLAGNAIRESIARDTAQQQLSILAKQFDEVEGALLLTERASQKFGLGLTETTGQITQVYARLRPLGATLEEIETVFNGFNTAARLGGSTAAEASGAFLQLSQALGSGYLRGQEFNSVAEQAPMVLQAIAKETGLAVGQLKEFAAEGGITSDIVLRALKRIETEGAGQLAQALDTPQQAIKDLQNAAEDLNVEVGRIVQPAVLAFIKELTGVLKETTTQLNEAAKAAEFLGTKLQPLVEIGNAVAGALDGMGVSLGNFVGEIFKALPGIGQLIRAYETLASITGFLAQQQDNSKGGRNFGANYKEQEKALFAAAGGYSPYASGGGLSGGSGSGSGSEKSAADEAARQAEEAAQQLKAAQDLVFASENRLRLLKEMTPIEKLQEEAAIKKLEIERSYAEKLEASATAAETALLQVAQTNELKAVELELEQQLADLRDNAVSGIEDEIALLEAKIAGKEDEYRITKAIKDLEAGGVNPEEAKALVTRRNELEKNLEAQEKLKASIEATTGVIADNLGQAFKDVITGAKSADEALQQAFANIGEAFIDMAIDIIKQQLLMIANAIIMKALGVSTPVLRRTNNTNGAC